MTSKTQLICLRKLSPTPGWGDAIAKLDWSWPTKRWWEGGSFILILLGTLPILRKAGSWCFYQTTRAWFLRTSEPLWGRYDAGLDFWLFTKVRARFQLWVKFCDLCSQKVCIKNTAGCVSFDSWDIDAFLDFQELPVLESESRVSTKSLLCVLLRITRSSQQVFVK